jgi:hypothetical protein
MTTGRGTASGRLEGGRRPSFKLRELDQGPGRSQAGPKPFRASPVHNSECGGQHGEQYRSQTPALGRALDRGAQCWDPLRRGGWLDTWQ